MGTTIPLRDVIGKAVDILLIGVIPLHGHFHGDAIFTFLGEVEHLGVDGCLVLVQILNERADPAFIMEMLLTVIAFILEADGNP